MDQEGGRISGTVGKNMGLKIFLVGEEYRIVIISFICIK